MSVSTPNNDINSLSPEFRKRFDPWRAEVLSKYSNARVFEARRTQERQNWLYTQGRSRPGPVVTWTLESNHIQGNAVDVVFLSSAGKPTRQGPYDDLINMAKKYGIANLKPRETCHFELDPSAKYEPIDPNHPKTIAIREAMKSIGEAWTDLNATIEHVQPQTQAMVKDLQQKMHEMNQWFRNAGY